MSKTGSILVSTRTKGKLVATAMVLEGRRGGAHRDRSHLVGVARVHPLSGFVTQELQSLLLHQQIGRSGNLLCDD